MLKVKHYLIAFGTVLIFTLLACIPAEASDMEQAECLPHGLNETLVDNAYQRGLAHGKREGYVRGQIDLMDEALAYFYHQCEEPGTVIELKNGVKLVCQ